MMRRLVITCGVVLSSLAAHADAPASTGFTATLGVGINNVDAPFAEAQLGRRFRCAPFFELFLDYSYDRPISNFSFQTFGTGVRTYLVQRGKLEVFHQAVAALAVSSSGRGPVENRDLGQRLLGAMLTQGIGAQMAVHRAWNVALTLSIGTPVWLRPELSARFTF